MGCRSFVMVQNNAPWICFRLRKLMGSSTSTNTLYDVNRKMIHEIQDIEKFITVNLCKLKYQICTICDILFRGMFGFIFSLIFLIHVNSWSVAWTYFSHNIIYISFIVWISIHLWKPNCRILINQLFNFDQTFSKNEQFLWKSSSTWIYCKSNV
jgi:hypothetical protein